ncbi:family 1 glycosylhydrolase [Candidatus Gottesmanbacteria bacterium]|nr:family 1 glycosylhydrolase [Candidatus Gottesmanbacteria bacterium]
MLNDIVLPHDFTFGIAESDLQTVGSFYPQKFEKSQKTMWEIFAKRKEIDVPLYGSYKYLKYKDDAKLITDLGVKAYRTSVSMSRTIDKMGKVNKTAFKWYRNYLHLIKSKGIKIHLCLYHWEAPEIFSQEGILNINFLDYFLKHIKITEEYLSDLVDFYVPINESWCISYLSYFVGIQAPGYKSLEKFFQAYFKVIHLQTEAIQYLKSKNPKNKIGLINIHFPTYIQTQFVSDSKYLKARNLADNITNYIFSDPFFMGEISEVVMHTFKKLFPKNHKDIIKKAKLGNLIDYYGINYYNSQYVKPAKSDFGYEQVIPKNAMRNSLGWPVSLPPYYPNGLTDILLLYSRRYAKFGLKSLMVSENGVPLNTKYRKNEIPNDDFRIYFINKHLEQIQKAVSEGAKVDGYFLWTLLDNYEWQEGYRPESAFGIVALDKKTGKRIPKKSYFWYQKLIKNASRI